MLGRLTPVLLAVCSISSMALPVLAQVADFVHDCDTFAAHPDDPNRWASGVSDEEIIPGPAVKFCTDAVASHPETPRFQFQLGRALWAAQRFADGNAIFMALQETHEYAPAYAYLGSAFALGLGGVEVDNEMALQLYEVAAAGGFVPAEVATQEAAVQAPSVTPQETTESMAAVATPEPAPEPATDVPLDLTGFNYPKVITALDAGDLGGLETSGMGALSLLGVSVSKLDVYLAGFDEEFSGSLNFKDPTCVQLHNPRVTQALERKIVMAATGGGTSTGAAANALGMFLNSMKEMQSGNMMGMVDQQREVELVRIEGERDASKLILGYGCMNESVTRIYTNLSAHVLGMPPVVSAAQKQKQAALDAQSRQKRAEEAKRRAAEAEANRQRGLRTSAKDACKRQYDDEPLCTCLVEGLDTLAIDTAAWQTVGRSFDQIVSLRAQYAKIPDLIRECRKRADAG